LFVISIGVALLCEEISLLMLFCGNNMLVRVTRFVPKCRAVYKPNCLVVVGKRSYASHREETE
jgi:hypothetical protein